MRCGAAAEPREADEPDVGSFTTQREHPEPSHLRLELDDVRSSAMQTAK